MKSASTWLFRPASIDGEIFSSYLSRIASAHGLSSYRFYSFHFPGLPVWNRDIDRNASDAFISEVAKRCGIPIETIYAMTLRDFEVAMNDRTLSKKKANPAIAPWVNAAGIFHRDRKCFAMQYCPHCLAIDRIYKRVWRLSFVTVCKSHGCSLLDCCPHCGAHILFHRNDTFHPTCHRCARSLLHFFPSKVDEEALSCRLHLQEKLFAAVLQRGATIGGQAVTSQELFSGLAIVMRALKSIVRTSRRLGHFLPDAYADCPTERIELLRIDDRARQCMVFAKILNDWPSQFSAFASSQGITQASFKKERPPSWLNPVVAALPIGLTRSRKAAVSPIRNELRVLHRNKHESWRTERARLLLKKAKIRT